VQVVDALADGGADLGWMSPRDGATALHVAAERGHAGAVRSLAARGGQAAVDARNVINQTPLHWAAANGETAAAQELLEAGADASLKEDNGMTALELAEKRGKHEVAALLR
jgi:ankyrin repeat protein